MTTQVETAEEIGEAQQQFHAPSTAQAGGAIAMNQSVHPGAMIQAMIQQHKDLDVEKLKGLFELQKEYDAELARKAFFDAKAKFAALAPVITTDGHVKFNRTDYRFASLGGTMEQIRGALEFCGLQASWKLTESEDFSRIRVTCHLTHSQGYGESTSLSAPQQAGKGDTGMNSLQAMKSTVSYLERITLYALLGLASKEDDDDGKAGGEPIPEARPKVTPAAAKELDDLCASAGINPSAILHFFKIDGFADLPASQYPHVRKRIETKISEMQPADADEVEPESADTVSESHRAWVDDYDRGSDAG